MERLKRIKINARLDWIDDADGVIERVDWLQEGDFRWLIKQVEKVEWLEKELEEMTEDRNTWRSNSLEWNGEEDEELEDES